MKKQINLFFTALMFYTRIPCPKHINHDEEMLNRATRYFPLIGYIVALISFIVLYSSYYLFQNIIICSVFILISNLLITGAFHEDGFADMCDGFGGGWSKEKILEIMKDSRVGTYGATGLLVILGLKIYLLQLILNFTFVQNSTLILDCIWILILAHSLSRFCAVCVAYYLPYVREDELSKAKPIAKQHYISDLIFGGVFSIIPLIFLALKYPSLFIALPIGLCFTLFFLIRFFKKWLGGYTGDCLGATQQIVEIVIYLTVICIWRFT